MDYPEQHYNPDDYSDHHYGPDDNYDQPINYNETGTIGTEIVTFFQIFLGLLSFSGCIQIFYISRILIYFPVFDRMIRCL